MKRRRDYQRNENILLLGVIVVALLGLCMCLYLLFFTDFLNETDNVKAEVPQSIIIDTSEKSAEETNEAEDLVPDTYYQITTVTDDDLQDIIDAVYQITPTGSDEEQQAIAQVIINRMKYHNETAEEVLKQEDQFEEITTDGVENDLILSNVMVASYGKIPIDVFFFSREGYPDWDGAEPYMKIGDYYFSTSTYVTEDYETAGYKGFHIEQVEDNTDE